MLQIHSSFQAVLLQVPLIRIWKGEFPSKCVTGLICEISLRIFFLFWSIADGTGMHKMESKDSRSLSQLWNCPGVTTRVLQIIANKSWTYQILLSFFIFLFPLLVRIRKHIIHNFLKAKHKIWVFCTSLKKNYKLMHIHIFSAGFSTG